jgi:NADH-quinone oxidoreductase subunit M
MDFNSYALSLLILIPALGSLLCLGPWFPKGRGIEACRWWAVLVSALVLALTLALVKGSLIEPNATLSMEEARTWIPSFGITYHLKLDGLSAVFVALTAVISLVVIAWSARPKEAGRAWYALLLAAEASVIGAFLATDLVLFYVFYELMLLPVVAGIALWGGARKFTAALKFLLYTVLGSVLMLLAILYLGWAGRALLSTGETNFAFEITTLSSLQLLTEGEELWVALAFLIAFAVKIPMVPLHSWVPDTYREAPHGVAAFTAALLGKVGIYAIVRFMWPLFPTFMQQAAPALAVVGAVGIVYGALVAMAQKDIRSLLAYSSISHLGFCVLGLASLSEMAVTGAVFQALSHGLVTAALFLVFGVVIDREGARDFESLGGLAPKLPWVAFFLMVFSIASVALPLTSSFVGEFLIILGSWANFPQWTLLALLGVVLGAVYTLTAYLKTMFGTPRPSSEAGSRGDLRGTDVLVATALALSIFILGLFPQRVLTLIEGALQPHFDSRSVASASHSVGSASAGEASVGEGMDLPVVPATDSSTNDRLPLDSRSL